VLPAIDRQGLACQAQTHRHDRQRQQQMRPVQSLPI
jgi:hypothetical protein